MDIVDLLLAILHHFLVFTLAGLLAAEFALVRPGLSGPGLGLLGRIDGAYGGIAMAIIVVGICRVLFGLKGWEYYVTNHAFWGKMIAFVIVGLLSIRPTMRIIAWRRSGTGVMPDGEIAAVRSWLKGEIFFLALVLVFAATMARGF
jgi:putative membrane protein